MRAEEDGLWRTFCEISGLDGEAADAAYAEAREAWQATARERPESSKGLSKPERLEVRKAFDQMAGSNGRMATSHWTELLTRLGLRLTSSQMDLEVLKQVHEKEFTSFETVLRLVGEETHRRTSSTQSLAFLAHCRRQYGHQQRTASQ